MARFYTLGILSQNDVDRGAGEVGCANSARLLPNFRTAFGGK
ncbi:hypothetical protein NIES4106_28760 [Fischerella sp. NIES-4106]|jgi:hypothetical protein|nr:hypothetical protein NIES4106_28760 [Fischerella sp. NIES-4106]